MAKYGVAYSKEKAIWTLLPYAIRLSGGGQQRMIGAFSRTFRSNTSITKWNRIEPFITGLFDKPSIPSMDRAITLVSPYFHSFDQNTLAQWSMAALATLAVPYTEEVGQSVADTLWRITLDDALRQHIPVGIWLWSSKQTFILPAQCIPPERRVRATVRIPPTQRIPPARRWYQDPRGREAVRQFRALGDIEILKSYLLLVWLEWTPLEDSAFAEMRTSIREDFNGIGMGQHREDLRKRLDHVLGQLDRGPKYLMEQRPHPYISCGDTEITENQYWELKQLLLEVDREAMEILTRTPSRFTILFGILTSVDTYRISLDVHV